MSPVVVCLIGMLVVISAILALRLHAFLALMLATLVVMLLTPFVPSEFLAEASDAGLGKQLATLLGNGVAKVGLLIALAAIIGQCLFESRAAERIVQGLLSLFGIKRAPLAFLSSGFFLGIPVFFDTVFYLLLPLVREFSRKTKGNYLLGVLCVVAGGSMAHSLVPPTPGPLGVMETLHIDLGTMMIAGILLGLVTMSVGFAYAVWANKRWPLELRETLTDAGMESKTNDAPLPSLGFSLLPLLIPFGLIILGTLSDEKVLDFKTPAIAFFSDKIIAIAIGAVLALILLATRKTHDVSESVKRALASGGIIILITAAGAAFGVAMKDAGIAKQLESLMNDPENLKNAGTLLLVIAFGLTALVRMAQGSASVAMLTTVGVIAPIAMPLIEAGTLGFHPVYLALALGCGSKPGPWMNDSGFWVVARMSGMTEVETLRSFSVQLTLMGVAGFLVTWLMATILPLVP